jgi:hypothetical protein
MGVNFSTWLNQSMGAIIAAARTKITPSITLWHIMISYGSTNHSTTQFSIVLKLKSILPIPHWLRNSPVNLAAYVVCILQDIVEYRKSPAGTLQLSVNTIPIFTAQYVVRQQESDILSINYLLHLNPATSPCLPTHDALPMNIISMSEKSSYIAIYVMLVLFGMTYNALNRAYQMQHF